MTREPSRRQDQERDAIVYPIAEDVASSMTHLSRPMLSIWKCTHWHELHSRTRHTTTPQNTPHNTTHRTRLQTTRACRVYCGTVETHTARPTMQDPHCTERGTSGAAWTASRQDDLGNGLSRSHRSHRHDCSSCPCRGCALPGWRPARAPRSPAPAAQEEGRMSMVRAWERRGGCGGVATTCGARAR